MIKFHTGTQIYTESLLDKGFLKTKKIEIYNQQLTGNTGKAGNINVGFYGNKIYIENRSGTHQYIQYNILGV